MTTWLRRGYEFGQGRKYIESLDLTSGSALVADCEAACPWFGDTVVAARNYLRLMVQRAVATNRGQIQVVLLGPDMSPFCLELLESMPNVRALFEVGGPSLRMKEELVRTIAPRSVPRLRFQVTDIGAPGLKALLVDGGDNDLQAEMPTIALVENASQFSADALASALGAFRSSGRNLVIAHHMVPYSEATESGTAQRLEEAFRRHCPQWRPHSSESMRSLLIGAGAKTAPQQGMHAFESVQQNGPLHFVDSEGWSRITYGVM